LGRDQWQSHQTVPIIAVIDASRRSMGFLDIAQILALSTSGIVVLDPFSTLVSPGVELSSGVVLFPHVTLDLRNGGRLRIGIGTNLMSGTHIQANSGSVAVGDHVEIGEAGGFSIKARAGDEIVVGDRARLAGGGIVSESCDIGHGAQVLGRIDVRNCRLGAGGDYQEPDPDRRGAVLKGAGLARDFVLDRGRVVQAFGVFAEADARWQSFFHPPGPLDEGHTQASR
jgi:carbonic anhydrase/acetyltransferase-like protein (isoleucine patch superfamily)